jgi:hypothetical protein
MVNLGALRDYYADLREHERLSAALRPADRDWLHRMADVLPPGWVIRGMAVWAPSGVVPDSSYPTGLRVVTPPPGPAGQARALPPELTRVDPAIMERSVRW